MDWLAYVVAAIFFLVGAGCIVLVVLQLPGTWIMLGLAVLLEWADRFYLPADAQVTFGWWVLGVCFGLTALGEGLELLASAAGAKTGGASARGIWGAIIGGIVGAIVLTFWIPIPILGTLIGAVIGAFVGAVMGEVTGAQPKSVRASMKPALGASIGRVMGTLSKVAIAIVVWLVLSVAAFLPTGAADEPVNVLPGAADTVRERGGVSAVDTERGGAAALHDPSIP